MDSRDELEKTWQLLVVLHRYAQELSIENGVYEAGTEQEVADWIAGLAEKYGFTEE